MLILCIIVIVKWQKTSQKRRIPVPEMEYHHRRAIKKVTGESLTDPRLLFYIVLILLH